MSTRRIKLAATALALVVVLSRFEPRQASAAIVEIAVSGRIGVDDQPTLLPDEIKTGEPWTGVIRYDLAIADGDPDAKSGYYFDETRPNGISITVDVHGHRFYGGNGELQAQVLNDIVFDPNQVINFPSGDSFAIGGPMSQSPRLLDISQILFYWHDASSAALLGDSLPTNVDPFAFVQNGVFSNTGLPKYSPVWIVIYDVGASRPYKCLYRSGVHRAR